MRYELEYKLECVNNYLSMENRPSIEAYVKNLEVSTIGFKKWLKKYSSPSLDVVDVIPKLCSSNPIKISISGIETELDKNYNEDLLIHVVRSLKNQWLI